MEGSSTKPRHDRNLITVFLCMAGIAVNLLLSTLAAKLELPLYLDTVGSITVAVLGGSLPGVIVGFATNVFKSITAIEGQFLD